MSPPLGIALRLVAAFWLLAWPVASPAADLEPAAKKALIPNEKCLECHSDKDLTKDLPGGKKESLFVDEKLLHSSVHAGVACAQCHSDVTDEHPDQGKVGPVHCATCHKREADIYATSIHGVSRSMGSSGAATCTSCHGTHDMLSARNPDSPVYKLNLARTCAKCHANKGITDEYRMRFPNVAAQYGESIHGRAVQNMGLIVAPSCNDCHGVHDIKRAVDRDSPINHANIARTCGKCHVGIEAIYDKSIHGQLLAVDDPRGPVCTDCHSAHEIVNPAANNFKAISDERCGRCHEDRLVGYRDTYHGKAMALGRPNTAPAVAACYDCHGFHDVLPASNTASHLSRRNILATCRKCHPDATTGFTEYQPHADPLDGKHYPLFHAVFLGMTGLLIGVFSFFGLHTFVWLFRAGWLYLSDSKKFREAKFRTQTGDEWFTRFVPFERFLHFLIVTSFLLLVLTGMPLKFYYTDWARFIFSLIGGPETARVLHRLGALVTFFYFGLHLISLTGKAWKDRGDLRDPETGKIQIKRLWPLLFGPDSMVPSIQDWRDFVAHNKWFFGKGPKPQFDRWTYWEKFDYFAVFWGVAIIGASGLIMWFPAFFTRFLPGWIINIALIIHSDEALLAAGFIFAIHFFNTHFRIEKFPMDTVIFSGRISKSEMLHERKRWYDRLVSEGRLDQHRVRDEWQSWRSIARPIGFTFFGIGMVLLILIIYAMLSRLAH